MPRPKIAVKNKRANPTAQWVTPGAIDLHFHGAFGIDLMSADLPELDALSSRLWRAGMAGFCATTLSVGPRDLRDTVTRLGRWIRRGRAPGARPLGIHLEGPFIHPGACGAHPPEVIRPLTMRELEDLWDASQGTLKILTLAPEKLAPGLLPKLVRWCRARKLVLSLGHSKASEKEAAEAFRKGFTGVTHAWNAMPFHQRNPGVLGAALGNPKLHLELIIDQVHVAPAVIAWTLAVHGKNTCFVSDCVPAAATRPSTWHSFGDLKIQFADGACRLSGGALAGGGVLLPEAFARWVKSESKRTGQQVADLVDQNLGCLSRRPLEALGLSPSAFRDRRVTWKIGRQGQVRCFPIQG